MENAQTFNRTQMLDNPLKSMVCFDNTKDFISSLQKSNLVDIRKSQKALRGLCASLLHMHLEEIRAVEVLNPIEFGDHPQDKEFVLDLKVMLNNDRILNFEVQVSNKKATKYIVTNSPYL